MHRETMWAAFWRGFTNAYRLTMRILRLGR